MKRGVSIIIPCCNQQHYLAESFGSCITQTMPPEEIIVIDDGSHEPVYLPDLPTPIKTRLVRVTNRGLPSARNVGLMLTQTDGFLPLDADDWIDEMFIEKMYPLLYGADVVVPGLQEHGPTRNGTYMPGYDRPLQDVTLDILWSYNRFFYCSLMRTDLLKSIGGYNGRMTDGYEDWDMWIDLMTRGAKFVPCNEVLFHYRTRPDSMLSLAESKRLIITAEMRRHHNM